MVDQARFQTEVDKLTGLGIKVIVGAHTPIITGSSIPQAFEQLAKLPSTVPSPMELVAAHP